VRDAPTPPARAQALRFRRAASSGQWGGPCVRVERAELASRTRLLPKVLTCSTDLQRWGLLQYLGQKVEKTLCPHLIQSVLHEMKCMRPAASTHPSVSCHPVRRGWILRVHRGGRQAAAQRFALGVPRRHALVSHLHPWGLLAACFSFETN
jgi:hypothetical protein